jgi:uncharacterized hydantoinase/oxoprolinase family protein
MSVEATHRLAADIHARQKNIIHEALERVAAELPGPPRDVVLAGSGEFLAREVLCSQSGWNARIVSLGESLGPGISEAACAYAVSILAAEEPTNGSGWR